MIVFANFLSMWVGVQSLEKLQEMLSAMRRLHFASPCVRLVGRSVRSVGVEVLSFDPAPGKCSTRAQCWEIGKDGKVRNALRVGRLLAFCYEKFCFQGAGIFRSDL